MIDCLNAARYFIARAYEDSFANFSKNEPRRHKEHEVNRVSESFCINANYDSSNDIRFIFKKLFSSFNP